MKASKSIKTLAAAMAVVMVMAAVAFAQNSYIIDHNVGFGVGVQPTFKATSGSTTIASGSIQQVIDAIRAHANTTDAAVPAYVVIRFGTDDVLNIGAGSVFFANVEGSVWPDITLNGKITSAPQVSLTEESTGTVNIASGVSVITTADIASTSSNPAITVGEGGTVSIRGTVTATNWTGPAISSERIGAAIGNIILDGSPTINGFIEVQPGRISAATTFNPQSGVQYTLRFSGQPAAGDVAVIGGAGYAANFTLIALNENNFTLTESGDDLVLHNPTTSVISRSAAKGGQFGIVQNGASLRVVGTAQATRIRVYDVRGKAVMSRAAMPNERIAVSHLARGTYVVKAAGKSVRLVRQ